jgi:hypothetical protein
MESARYKGPPQRRSGVEPPDALYARVRADVEAAPAATRRTRLPTIAVLAAIPALTAVVVLIASEIVYQRPAAGLEVVAHSIPALRMALAMIVGLAVVSTLIAVWRGSSGLGAGAASLASIVGLVAPLYAALILPHPVHAHDSALTAVEISPWGLRCFIIATIVGVLALASFSGALRRAVPVASRLRGAALGAAAGAWAGLAVFIFCPSGEQFHLFVGHVIPIIAFTLVGGMALSRALRP